MFCPYRPKPTFAPLNIDPRIEAALRSGEDTVIYSDRMSLVPVVKMQNLTIIYKVTPNSMTAWKDIRGYEGIYQIASNGDIKSLDRMDAAGRKLTGKPKKTMTSNIGYIRVALTRECISNVFLVHRLVAESFIPNHDNKTQVNHIDGNKANNDISNLEWVTASENIRHAVTTGLRVAARGSTHGNASMDEFKVRLVKSMIQEGMGDTKIARSLEITRNAVKEIRANRTWKHIL